MENYKLKQYVYEAVREEIRKGRVVKYKEVLEMLPDLIDGIYIDKSQLKDAAENCLQSKNPLNSVLNLFGLQIIRKEKAIENLINPDYDNADISINVDKDDLHFKDWLTINPEELKAVVEKIADKLCEFENEVDSEIEEERANRDDLFSKNEQLKIEYNQYRTDVEIEEKNIAQRIQTLLSENGEDAVEKNDQLIELLEDMQIEVYWNCENAPLSESAMFSKYKTNDSSMKPKPCLMRKGEAFIKGIVFDTNFETEN